MLDWECIGARYRTPVAEAVVVLFGPDARALREAKATAQNFLPDVEIREVRAPIHEPRKMASNVLAKALAGGDRPVPAEACLLLNGLPAVMYEALLAQETRESFNVARIRLLDTDKSWPDHNVELMHQAPEQPLAWEDREFNIDLLDEHEREAVKTALLRPASVLITGGYGTGKTLLARYIHYHTRQTASGTFVPVNLSAVPTSIFQAELEGTGKHVATDVGERPGLLAAADRGTLFLDEVAEADDEVQARLLHLVKEHDEPVTYRRVGEDRSRQVRVRFIAATNTSLDRMRSDLRSRFLISIHLRPLTEKSDGQDIAHRAICHYLALEFSANPILCPMWPKEVTRRLYEDGVLPGNLRDLRTLITRVADAMQLKDRPPDTVIRWDEINGMLNCGPRGSYDAGVGAGPSDLVESIEGLCEQIGTRCRGLVSARTYREDEIKRLVFALKRTALAVACDCAGSNCSLARRLYGMPNAAAFEQLRSNPDVLHPDARKRRRGHLK